MKKRLARLLSLPALTRPLGYLLIHRMAIVFGLHRFGETGSGMTGHSLDELDRRLRFLRAHEYRIATLNELFRVAEGGTPPAGSGPLIAFTVDDGYADFAQAARVFHEHQCPVTVFLTSGFLDGNCWFWWDQVEFMIENATPAPIELRDARGGGVTFEWSANAVSRQKTRDDLIAFLKTLPEDRFAEARDTIARSLGVVLPRGAPDRYQPMTWDEVRECRRLGIEFAPHTVTHPILANVSESVAKFEITHSYARLTEQLDEVVPILAYPNGDRDSFGAREERLAREAGLSGAVSTVPGYWELISRNAMAEGTFHMPRFSYPDDWIQFAHILNGLDRLKRARLAAPARQ